MNRFFNTAFAVAAAIAGTAITSCSLDNHDNETEAPFVTCPVAEKPSLVCYGIAIAKTTTAQPSDNVVFTDNDIVYFDPETREIKFYGEMDSLYKSIPLLGGIQFCLDGEPLFEGGCTHVGLICSQVFTDIVLCYGHIDDSCVIDPDHYYLLDCYPPQLADTDEVKANRERRAGEWARFVEYLDGKGKLRKH